MEEIITEIFPQNKKENKIKFELNALNILAVM